MHYANSYRGGIPFSLYLWLQTYLPQQYPLESDVWWLKRVKRTPHLQSLLAQNMYRTPEFKTELKQGMHRRLMAQAGAKRVGKARPGPALTKVTKPGGRRAVSTIARRYRDEFMVENETKYKYEAEAYEMLLELFEATTPPDGCVFWNGINELALAKLVDQWNEELAGEVYGQLEATTPARYVNKKFVWEAGEVFERYFTQVSEQLGAAARGHVTAVARCGLRDDSIFTTTELPRMINAMAGQLKAGQQPGMTDITIVLIEPKQQKERPVKAFVNDQISMVPIVSKTARFINGRDDCRVASHVNIPPIVREYWAGRQGVESSSAAKRIMKDFESLTRWN